MHPWPNRTGLAALPHDLLLAVYALLDVPDALALAKTCRALHAFAVSRAAWLTLARTLAVTRALALPADKQTTTVPADLSTAEMRAAVQHTTRLASNLLRPSPSLVPVLSLALPEETTVVHATLLPGARFLLTAQHGGTFACWDLAVTEPTPHHPTLPRRRSIRTQTHSVDGVDVEMGSESDNEPSDPDPDARHNLRRPRCVATWETGAEYVEFAHDLVPGGVLVALMVAIQVGADPPILKRDMYVVRIDLPTSTCPLPTHSTPAPSFVTGRTHGLTFLAHSPLRQPVFISTTFVDAAGHAGILGDIPDTMVVFVLLFDPTSPAPCASSLVHCGFKCEPGARYTALGTSTHVLLYAESASKTIARRIDVRSMKRRWAASPSASLAGTECVDLGIKLLGTPRSRLFVGNPGTEGAQSFTTVRVTLRRKMPKWLRRYDSDDDPDDDPAPTSQSRGSGKAKRRNQPITVSALGLSVDVENRSTDIFRGVALGSHDIEPDTESDSSESESDSTPSARFQPHTTRTLPDSYNLPTPSQSSLLAPAPAPLLAPVPAPTPAEKQKPDQLPLRRSFRRACRVRYKRTIFPAHVNYAHELAGVGSFGRYAAWIEGDGVPEDVDWAKEPLRVVIAPLEWEKGGELGEGWDEERERRRAGEMARVVEVRGAGVRDKLNLVSCVAMEDAVGVIAMATVDGQVVLGSLV